MYSIFLFTVCIPYSEKKTAARHAKYRIRSCLDVQNASPLNTHLMYKIQNTYSEKKTAARHAKYRILSSLDVQNASPLNTHLMYKMPRRSIHT